MKEKIVPVAQQYIGFRETPNNSGFTNKDFENRMRAVGWSKSLAWCSFFAELVWKEAYAGNAEMLARFDKLFNGSATATYKNFDLNKLFTCDMNPVAGALAIYRFGNGWQGHVGIVEKIEGNKVWNIEGNGARSGTREGVEVVRKDRLIKTKYSEKGLNIIGYIHPM